MLQSIYSQLLPTPEGHVTMQIQTAPVTHTVKPSSQVQSASGIHYLSMSANYRRRASRLDWTLSNWCEWPGLVFNPPRSTAPFLSATIVLSTLLHRCSTSRTCTLVAVRYYSISELAPCWKGELEEEE